MINGHVRRALTGGGSAALDAIPAADCASGDIALVFASGVFYWFVYDAEATLSESAPTIIRPDDYTAGGNWVMQSSQQGALGSMPAGVELQGQIVGLDCSAGQDSDHDVSVGLGACMDSTGDAAIKLSAVMVKRIDADWIEGSGNGGLLNGPVAANTVYHFYALLKDSDSSVDFGWLADGEEITAHLPAGYSKYRWLRFHKTDAAANLCQTTQNGDYIVGYLSSDWVVSTAISTTYATINHSPFIPEDRIELIKYGVRCAASAANAVSASDDGLNLSFHVGAGYANTTSTTHTFAWGYIGNAFMGMMPFYADRQFKAADGVNELLVHAIKMRR